MSFLVKGNWEKLRRTIWTTLEKRKLAPMDMYIELLRFARRKMGIQVDMAADAALSDPQLAREEFLKLQEPQSEAKCVEVMEGFYQVLREFTPEFADQYKSELKEFIEEHNLRYTLSEDCQFRLSVQGILVSQALDLRRALSSNPDLLQALSQLEHSVAELRSSAHEEGNCIRIAANLLEGIVCAKTTNGADTLNMAVEGCNAFPHRKVMECVKDFYRFASDYPNIRHAGNPANKIRDLKKDDALLAVAFAIAFGAYVYDNDAAGPVIDGHR